MNIIIKISPNSLTDIIWPDLKTRIFHRGFHTIETGDKIVFLNHSSEVPLYSIYSMERSKFGPIIKYLDCIDYKVTQLHYNLWFRHRQGYRLMRQDLPAVDVQFVLHYDIFAQHCAVLHPHPATNHRSPANYAAV